MFFDVSDLYGIVPLNHYPKLSDNLSSEILMEILFTPIWLSSYLSAVKPIFQCIGDLCKNSVCGSLVCG